MKSRRPVNSDVGHPRTARLWRGLREYRTVRRGHEMRIMFPLALLLAGLVLVMGSPPTADTQASNGAVAQFQAVANSQTFPRYDRVLLLETTSDTSANVSVGDLNGDGNLDFLVVKGRHWPLM